MALCCFSESLGSRAENANSSPWLSSELPQGTCYVCAMLTDQSLLFQQARPADLETLSPIATGSGWDFRYHFRLNHHHLSAGSRGSQEEFQFHKLWASSRSKGRRNWKIMWQEPENQHRPQKILKKNSEKEAIKTQVKGQWFACYLCPHCWSWSSLWPMFSEASSAKGTTEQPQQKLWLPVCMAQSGRVPIVPRSVNPGNCDSCALLPDWELLLSRQTHRT